MSYVIKSKKDMSRIRDAVKYAERQPTNIIHQTPRRSSITALTSSVSRSYLCEVTVVGTTYYTVDLYTDFALEKVGTGHLQLPMLHVAQRLPVGSRVVGTPFTLTQIEMLTDGEAPV